MGVVGKLVHKGGSYDVVWYLGISKKVVDGDVRHQLSGDGFWAGDNTSKPTAALSAKLYHQLIGDWDIGKMVKVELLQVVCKPLICSESVRVTSGRHSGI